MLDNRHGESESIQGPEVNNKTDRLQAYSGGYAHQLSWVRWSQKYSFSSPSQVSSSMLSGCGRVYLTKAHM